MCLCQLFMKGAWHTNQYVYVLNSRAEPVMPCSPRKARILLRDGKAKVVRRTPFTIQLLHCNHHNRQLITLGIDAGSKHIGISATTEIKELFVQEVEPRNDVVRLLSTRRELRRGRRHRKTRYRKPRFLNRTHSKHKGWLTPSVEVKIQEHITSILRVTKILPITEIVIEDAEFDMQRLQALRDGKPLPVGTDYQKGKMYDHYKSHINDARCISEHPLATPCNMVYRTRAMRHHNRQFHRSTPAKGGIRRRAQAPYLVAGFRLWDKVLYDGKMCFVTNRRLSGSFSIKTFDNEMVKDGITYKKLQLLEKASNYITLSESRKT